MELHFKHNEIEFFNNETPLHFAIDKGYIDIVKILIENGADVNAKSDVFQTQCNFILNINMLQFNSYYITYQTQ